MISARTFAGPLLVTAAYVVVYYAVIANQLRVRTRLRRAYRARGESFDRYFNTDREMLAADRYVGNMLEHMPTFLLLLWLNAVFVDPRGASVAGAAYVGARALYPFLLGRQLGKGDPARILLATGVGYTVIAYFVGAGTSRPGFGSGHGRGPARERAFRQLRRPSTPPSSRRSRVPRSRGVSACASQQGEALTRRSSAPGSDARVRQKEREKP